MASKTTTLTSMTGFACVSGAWSDLTWHWEVKSVNGKALDLRFRLPGGMEHLEAPARAAALAHVKRGNLQVSLNLLGAKSGDTLRVNQALLEQLVSLAEGLRDRLGAGPIQAENLLALRGVLDVSEPELAEDASKQRDAAIMASFEAALQQLAHSRSEEGARLTTVIKAQLARITSLAEAARDCPARQPKAVRQRLSEQVARILEQSNSFDPQRLHQEAVLIATRADIQEELDRLNSHIEEAQKLLASAEPVGRKFDFLAQEFNREANTLCSKAADKTLTSIGLDLKTTIDQLREQVQNIE